MEDEGKQRQTFYEVISKKAATEQVSLIYEEPSDVDQTKLRAESSDEISMEDAPLVLADKTGSGGSKGISPSITTSGDPRKNSSSSGDLGGITGQPISSLQRAIRNTIIGGVKSSISMHSNAEDEDNVSKRNSESYQSGEH